MKEQLGEEQWVLEWEAQHTWQADLELAAQKGTG